jgi:SPX domain protein involved in polyphosphate accumulation
MSFRIEDKLYIRTENLLQFNQFLNNNSATKLFESRKIKSLYFDNLKFDMYNDSIEGSVPRKKIRIREYPNSNDKKYYFEIKTSAVEGRFKTREVIDHKKFLFFQKFGYLDETYGTCLPNYFVSYEREYFKIKDVRISIDNKINYINFLTKKTYFDDKTIVELKTSINKNQDDLAKTFPFQKIRFSKYCYAVENLK